MNDKYENLMKLVVIISTVIFTLIVSVYLIKDFIGRDILIAFIGFFGSIIGGSLTLIGVKWTMKNQEKLEQEKRYQQANFVFTELLPLLIAVYNRVKSLNKMKWDASRTLLIESAQILEETAEEMSFEARYIGIEFYREIKNVQYYSGIIREYMEEWEVVQVDDDLFEQISNFYQGLARADKRLLELVNEIKHS